MAFSRSGFGATTQLTLLTADPDLARRADQAGVDRIGIDIERFGKAERQRSHPGARLSSHRVEDLGTLSPQIHRARLSCRIDPPHPGSGSQIERAIEFGATSLTLPFFRQVREAVAFVDAVGGRAETILLVETAAAAVRIESLAALDGVDEIMIGLNDLGWDCRLETGFEFLCSPLMEAIANTVRARGKRLGIGGLARWDDDSLPVRPDLVYAQHARLGASAAWLARSFLVGLTPTELGDAVATARTRLDYWARQPPEALEGARAALARVLALT